MFSFSTAPALSSPALLLSNYILSHNRKCTSATPSELLCTEGRLCLICFAKHMDIEFLQGHGVFMLGGGLFGAINPFSLDCRIYSSWKMKPPSTCSCSTVSRDTLGLPTANSMPLLMVTNLWKSLLNSSLLLLLTPSQPSWCFGASCWKLILFLFKVDYFSHIICPDHSFPSLPSAQSPPHTPDTLLSIS